MGKSGIKKIADNRKARFEYEILETVEAGLVLTGTEVKSLREGRASIKEAYATVKGGEVYLIDCNISHYPQASDHFNHAPRRPRKLLLHRAEIRRLGDKIAQRGLTLVPLRMYFRDGWAKIELGLGRGKKLHDKRATIRARDEQRDLERALKERR